MPATIAPDAVARYREILLEMRESIAHHCRDLAEDAARSTEGTALSKSPLSLAENASEAFQLDLAFLNMESEEVILRKIDEALRRLDEGDYGVCADCGEPIAPERLDALPFATHCLPCQRAAEEFTQRDERAGVGFEILDDDNAPGIAGPDDGA